MAFLAEGRRLLWASMRSGNSGSANGCVEFIKQAVTVLPQRHRIGLLRADAGFFEKRFLEYLESQELPYIIVARLTAVVRKLVIHRIPSTAWRWWHGGSRWQIWKSVCRIGKQRSVALSVCVRRFRNGPRPEGTINRLSRIYVSGDGHQRTVCRRSG